MKRVLSGSVLCFVCGLLCGLLCGAETISFDRTVKVHDSFQCRIFTEQSIRYRFHLRGREQPVTRLETLQGAFDGYIKVLALNPQGNASSLQILLHSCHGSLNGKAVRFPAGKQGIRIRGDLSGSESRFSREDSLPLTAGETALLCAFFPPASSSKISDLTGRERVLPPRGHTLPLQPDPFLRALAQRKIFLHKNRIRGGLTYAGMEKVCSVPCHQFVIRMETDSLKNYDFRLKVTFCMGKESPVPLKMKREAQEILSRLLDGNDPFSGGSRVELHSTDRTGQWLIPVRKDDAEKLWKKPLPGKSVVPQGQWRTLLH